MNEYTCATLMLDYDCSAIQELVSGMGLSSLCVPDRIAAVCGFISSDILFSFCGGIRPASEVIASGHGNSMERCSVAMTMLRATGVSCRLVAHLLDGSACLELGGVGAGYRRGVLLAATAEAFYDSRWVRLISLSLDEDLLELAKPVDSGGMSDDALPEQLVHSHLGVFSCPEDAVRRFRQVVPWPQRVLTAMATAPKMDRLLLNRDSSDICAN